MFGVDVNPTLTPSDVALNRDVGSGAGQVGGGGDGDGDVKSLGVTGPEGDDLSQPAPGCVLVGRAVHSVVTTQRGRRATVVLGIVDLGIVGSAHQRDQSLWRGVDRDRTLGLTNGGLVMVKLFTRKSKMTEPGTGQTLPVSEAPPVDVPKEWQTAEAAQPVSGDGGSERPVPSWLDPLAVMFAPAWAVDEMIRVEEYWQDGTLVVRAELPGIDPDTDVQLTVADGRLAIEAERHEEGEVDLDGFMLRERRYGKFSRSLPLAAGVTAASIAATYKGGLLEVRIPAPGATPARIPVTTS
jgi:HSP20 family protein